MNREKPVDCKYCTRGRPPLKEDCFLGFYGVLNDQKQYVKRFQLNQYQNCVYYEFAGLIERVYRLIAFGIPITPNAEFYLKSTKK